MDKFINDVDNPMKKIWKEIRNIIHSTDTKIEEDIKWGAPTFIYKGNIATFNPRAKKFVNLTFHTGALLDDPDGVLEGDAKEARVFRIESLEELLQKKSGLEKVIKNWIELKDS